MDNLDQRSVSLSSDSDKISVVTNKSRGRPRMSRASLPLAGADMRRRGAVFAFVKEFLYKSFMAEELEAPFYRNSATNHMPAVIRFSKGDSDLANFLVAEDINLDYGRSKVKEERTSAWDEESRHRLMLPEYIEGLFCEPIEYRAKVQKPSNLPDRAAKMITAIYLRHKRGLKVREVAVRCRLSPGTVSKLLTSYRINPDEYVNKIVQATQPPKTFGDGALSAVKTAILTNAHLLTNKTKLCGLLRPFLLPKDEFSDWKLFARAKKEMPLTKRKPRIDRSNPAKLRPPRELVFADMAILKLFIEQKRMVIFDSSTFLIDKLGVTCWTLSGDRPRLPGSSKPAGIHLMLLLAPEDIGAVQVLKEGVREITTRDFLMWGLKKIVEERQGLSRIDYIFLDNATTNSEKIARELKATYGISTLYNYPSNPRNNPIEALFGVLKKKFRAATAGERVLNPESILQTIRDTSPEVVQKTIRHIKHRMTMSFSCLF